MFPQRRTQKSGVGARKDSQREARSAGRFEKKKSGRRKVIQLVVMAEGSGDDAELIQLVMGDGPPKPVRRKSKKKRIPMIGHLNVRSLFALSSLRCVKVF